MLSTAALVLFVDDEEQKNKKIKWSKQWQFSHTNLLKELQENEPADFKKKNLSMQIRFNPKGTWGISPEPRSEEVPKNM